MNIIDCTLRDGGYYTAWDFDRDTVTAYIEAMNRLPVDVVEVGYRSNPQKEYLGEFGYTPVEALKRIRGLCKKKIAVMVNEKSVRPDDLTGLLVPIKGLADIVRIAVDPKNFDRAVTLAKAVKALGFGVSFNMMYMSTWAGFGGLYGKLNALDGVADTLCMVDSYGGMTPKEVAAVASETRKHTNVALGFHGHDNLQMALANTLVAMECGAEGVDATILGMGRGAGNLKIELLLTFLGSKRALGVDLNILGEAVTSFEDLRARYRWGTNLPYMISGANNIPQKEVMEWSVNRVYSFNTIVRTLAARRKKDESVRRYPYLEISGTEGFSSVVIVGGGPGAEKHAEAINAYLAKNPDAAIVFATSRRAGCYLAAENRHYYCLAGDEGRRFMQTVGEKDTEGNCILPPFPREMETDVPECMAARTMELKAFCFGDKYKASVTAIALQLAMELTDGEIFLAGYDGYPGQSLSKKELALTRENQSIFREFSKIAGRRLVSLTPSLYSELEVRSVYQFV